MSATVLATGVTHGTSEHVDFHFYAHTACGLRVDWKETYKELTSLDPENPYEPRTAVRTDREVDCMACVAAEPREP